jgi:hypothetical protein
MAQVESAASTSSNARTAAPNSNECSSATARSKRGATAGSQEVGKVNRAEPLRRGVRMGGCGRLRGRDARGGEEQDRGTGDGTGEHREKLREGGLQRGALAGAPQSVASPAAAAPVARGRPQRSPEPEVAAPWGRARRSASRSATASALSAATDTSGTTPVPCQLPPVIGFTEREVGSPST